MRQHSFLRAAQWAATATLALVLLSGCTKSNPIDPSPTTSPGSSLLFGFQDEVLPFYDALDPGTPTDLLDDRLLATHVFSFGGDSTSAILQVVDFTPANLVRPYRREGSSAYRRVLDYDVPASDRQIGDNTDLFVLRDAEGVVGSSEYFVTALLNGVETTASPRTNALRPWGRTQTSLALSVGDLQRDSVLTLSVTPDPRAAIYVLEISSFDNFAVQRDLGFAAAIPMPVSMPHQFSGWGFVLPGQETSIRVPFFNVPFLRGQFPITLLCRVIALDAQGRVVGRPDTDYIRRATGRDDAGNSLYELDPLGGWVIRLDPYPLGYNRPQALTARATPGVFTSEQVREFLARFPNSAPASGIAVDQQIQTLRQSALGRGPSPLSQLRIGIGQVAPKGTFVQTQ